MIAYPVAITFDAAAGVFVVLAPGLPGGTQADTQAQARLHAVDYLLTAMEGCIAAGEPIPEPPEVAGMTLIPLPALEGAKVALYRAMTAKGMDASDLADALGRPLGHVRKLLDFDQRSSFADLDRALAALGKRLVVDSLDAAD